MISFILKKLMETEKRLVVTWKVGGVIANRLQLFGNVLQLGSGDG